ncbi:MAG TPA: ubiquinol-cytochrome C chaperone family protein [Rhizomicrobium sp.]
MKRDAERLCAAVMRQARKPAFFTQLGVADTMDGRFDLLVLHAWLVLERCAEPVLGQGLVDELFLHFDEALRQMGTGDMSMNRRLKSLASAFYGRLQAYREAAGAQPLAEAILRNLYRGADDRVAAAEAMATYALNARSHLASSFDRAELDFGPLPTM